MKIVFYEVAKEEHELYTKPLPDADVAFFDEKLSLSNTKSAEGADVISVFTDSKINKELIDALPSLKLIATRSTGYDHIDCEYAKSKGIMVANVPAYGSHTVAEFAFTLMLSLSRNIMRANSHIRETMDFNYNPFMEGFDLNGKTLGVIGTGKIGKNVIKIARGFEMNVVAYDLFPDAEFAKTNNFEYKTLSEVLAISDIVTLHAPMTKENFHLMNKENIAQMKRGSFMINTARGDLIDTRALEWGLKEGIIAGAGLDVLEGEAMMKGKIDDEIVKINHALMQMPNVIITPHVAFFTKEAVDAIRQTTIENIKSFISGTPINVVK